MSIGIITRLFVVKAGILNKGRFIMYDVANISRLLACWSQQTATTNHYEGYLAVITKHQGLKGSIPRHV